MYLLHLQKTYLQIEDNHINALPPQAPVLSFQNNCIVILMKGFFTVSLVLV